MASLEFQASDRETSHEYGTPARNISDIPIDPALGAPQIDPQLTGEQPVSNFQAQANLDVEAAQQTEHKHSYQYSDAPQGDPFAPQPEQPPYEPSPVPESTPRASKRKRRGRRETGCHFCKGNESENKKTGEPEFMLYCEDCGLKAHPTCVNVREPEVVRSYPWKCIECKTCESCGEKGDDSRILFCDRCDRGWHFDCLDPPLQGAPEHAWYCPECPKSMSQVSEDDLMDPMPEMNGVGKGKGRAVATSDSSSSNSSSSDSDDDNASDEASIPVKRLRGRKPKDLLQSVEASATPKTRKKKRKRPRVQNQSIALPTIRIRLKRGEEGQKGLFDDILTVTQRDVSKTTIISADKQRFDRTKTVADTKLAVQASSAARDSEQPEPGPSSRPLRSSTLQQITTATSSLSPAPSTPGAISLLPLSNSKAPLRIQKIRFGQYDIKTWFDAPFPEEYANIPDGRLWFCEFCLKYMKSRFGADRHRMKCKCRHPPGDEIYRDGVVSIFEVDGRKNKIYCQNLCLLSKIFLDHKSLFYDVEPFLFYVITEVNDTGAHFVGYFSKEKRSPKDYNVSCIMTLPVRQRQGWGNLLIDFSYLLSKKEQRLGSPEKPLSGLGAIGYKNYWTLALMRYLQTAPDHPRLEDISAATSMTLEDVHVILMQQNMITVRDVTPPPVRPSPGQTIKYPKGRKNGGAVRRHLQRMQTMSKGADKPPGPFVPPTHYEIIWDKEKVDQYLRNWEAKGYIRLRPEKLKWSPFILSRTQKTEALQATTTADLAPTLNGNANSDVPVPSKSTKASNGETEPQTPHFRDLNQVEHTSDEELPVPSAIAEKKAAAQLERDRILAEDLSSGQLTEWPDVPAPAKRPRGRPKKIVDPAKVETKPLFVDSPRQLRSHAVSQPGRSLTPSQTPRKTVESSPGADGNSLSCEPAELSNGIKTVTTQAVAFPSEHDVKSEGSSTPLTNRQSDPSDDTLFTVNALLGLKEQMPKDTVIDISGASKKSTEDVDVDADGDYDDDIEMEDVTRL